MHLAAALLLAGASFAQSWVPQNGNTTASLRGLSAVDARVVWASGTGGTFLRTIDGGATWIAGHVPGASDQDFRGVRAFDARTAVLMSKARIYRTTDGGGHWSLAFTHPDPKGFLDSIAFWDRANGIALGDPLDGDPDVRVTGDGGLHWERRPAPPALPNEGSFAASNTCLFLAGSAEVWFVTGGAGAARVFHSGDRGKTWTVAATPVRNDSPSAGIFSIAFDGARGIVVGGDYAKDRETRGNIALSADGGRTWAAPAEGPHGFRSAVAWVPELKLWVAAGTSGSDVSTDGGRSWRQFDGASYNTLSFASGGAGWAAGAGGRIARFAPPPR
jgi:photosystem II stability/assembly factor-like uncharacterized protein